MSEVLFDELRSIARERLRSCRQSLTSIERRAQELRDEIAEAERTIAILESLQPKSPDRPRTMTASILNVLEANPSGLSKGEILVEMRALFETVNSRSLDSLLSRLKHDSRIEGGSGQAYRLAL